MHKQQFLIADPSEILAKRLEEHLGDILQIHFCDNGVAAEEWIRANRPEFALVDMALPMRDGLRVLRQIREAGITTRLIASTTLFSPYVSSALEELGVEYVLVKPYNLDSAAANIRKIVQTDPRRYRLQQMIHPLLLSLGFSPSLEGFPVLCFCLEELAMDPGQPLVKSIYARAGMEFNMTPEAVERCVRSAVQAAWQHKDSHIWRLYIPDGGDDRPGNAVFLCSLAEILKRN